MALSELSSALPEKLPGKLAFSDLGSRFEAAQSKKLVQVQPQGSAPWGPNDTRLLRFNITSTSGDYLLPEGVRLQAVLNTSGANGFKPLSTMGIMFQRMRVICEGVVIQDLMHADRMHQWLTEDMSKEQYEELANESFVVTAMDYAGKPNHEVIPTGSHVRISMPFLQLGIFQNKQKYLPLRVAPIILELEFGTDKLAFLDTRAVVSGGLGGGGGEDVSWNLTECKLLMTTVQLDNALDNLLMDRWRKDAIVLKQREWNITRISLNPASASEFVLPMLKGMTRLCRIGVSFESPVDDTGEKRKAVTLYFPPGNQEIFNFHVQIGSNIKHPIYPVTGIRETYLRTRQANCHEALSEHNYRATLKRFGGSGGTEKTTGSAFRALIDVERICHDQADMTGEPTLGGVSLYAFFKGMLSGTQSGQVNGAPAGPQNWGVAAAYIHTEHVAMISLSSGGVVKED